MPTCTPAFAEITITAASADGGSATYTFTVTDSTVYYLPTFAGVYVNTDVQSGAYGVWNGVLIDAKTKNNYIIHGIITYEVKSYALMSHLSEHFPGID